MKKVDVLFLYETRVRELENICLLKYELERRGYTVVVQNTWNELAQKKLRPKYDAKVVVTHAMYHDGIYQFVKSIVGKAPKIVNMQCEQVGTIRDDEIDDARFVLRGVASQCMNICWGQQTVDRLMNKSGFDEAHIRLTGQITLDFCRKELRGYYHPREVLCAQYGLPQDCKLNLFISSFAYVNLPENITKQSEIKDKDLFIQRSRESFDAILQWFDTLLEQKKDQVVIYRPHPAEADNSKLQQMHKKYPQRFFVISELSVKQWVAISDRVYTWYSSSAAEVYMFDIPCAILRPVQIPRDMEIALFENAEMITDCKTFLASIDQGFETSLDPKVFNRFYDVAPTLSYVRVADAIEEVLQSDDYFIKYPPELPAMGVGQKVKTVLRGAVTVVADRLPGTLLSKYRTPPKKTDAYALQRQKNNFASDQEIAEIQARIANILAASEK